jgi:hypothetical protein
MLNFTIDIYRRDDLPDMLALTNRETAHQPHIAPLTPDLFIALVESKSYFDPKGLFVAKRNGRVVGWVHGCVN